MLGSLKPKKKCIQTPMKGNTTVAGGNPVNKLIPVKAWNSPAEDRQGPRIRLHRGNDAILLGIR